MNLLAATRFSFPAEASGLWTKSDGLPAPDDPQFAEQAARFLADHPVTSPAKREPTPWDTSDTASRQCKCLAYLAGGKAAGRQAVAQLCVTQAMQMLWSLPIRTGHGQSLDRVFCAAAGSLAFTGAIVRREAKPGSVVHATATQWLHTGAAGKVKDAERKVGQAILTAAGVDMAALALHGSDEAFFAGIDLTRPDLRVVAERVTAGDYEQAKRAYADALAERFSIRRGWPDIHFDKRTDLAEADDICRNVFMLQAHMFRRMDYGAEVDWALVVDQDVESRVWMNAHPWMWALLNAYQKTHDDKYVEHLCRLFRSWYQASPPTFQRTGAQWRTLETGNRIGQKWTSVLLALAEHPIFRRECLYLMARSMHEHGEYLSMYAAGGGNWLQVESSGLACAALLFPEFKLSPTFYDVAMHRLAWVNARAFLPDGFQSECSPGYHQFPLMGMAGALRLAKFLDRTVPESFMQQYEAAVDALQHIAYPDRTLPMLSDWNPGRASAVEVLQTGAEVFGRQDFLWLASRGRQGSPPGHTSHDFTHAGYCVMRDQWGPDGQMLVFDAGAFGAGHQHEDKLNFVFYAGGRELIGDPGIYSYKRDEFEPYWRGSWSHNTMMVDGLSQHRALGPAEAMPDPDRRFVRGKGFDFAVGWYRRAYSPRGAQVWKAQRPAATASPAVVLRNVQHQRCIFSAKGRFAVVCDRVTGEGEHQLDLLFHPAPLVSDSETNRTVRPATLTIKGDRSVITTESNAANVAILPVQGGEYEALDLIGRKNPVRGWFALLGVQPSHDIVYRWRGRLPRHCETVIQPLPAGEARPLTVASRTVTCGGPQTCAAVACGGDLFLIAYDGPAEMRCEDVEFHGTALLLERDPQGRPLRASTVDGNLLRVGGRLLRSVVVEERR
ncbi:MAG: alginate lyase family protein [Verrucomicrobia bacterium]|nr:alginate lyase family protein [Verrucomicrobiota bacterium]